MIVMDKVVAIIALAVAKKASAYAVVRVSGKLRIFIYLFIALWTIYTIRLL